MATAPPQPSTSVRWPPAVLALAGLTLLANGGLWLYVVLRLPSLRPELPIHYNAAGQVDRIGVRSELFILPAIGAVALAINLGLSAILARRDKQLCLVLLGVALLVQLLLFGAGARLMR